VKIVWIKNDVNRARKKVRQKIEFFVSLVTNFTFSLLRFRHVTMRKK
jgi:hypothetical protein